MQVAGAVARDQRLKAVAVAMTSTCQANADSHPDSLGQSHNASSTVLEGTRVETEDEKWVPYRTSR